MTSPILVAVFTIVYLAVTVWLCRGLKLNARNLAMGGLACALTQWRLCAGNCCRWQRC